MRNFNGNILCLVFAIVILGVWNTVGSGANLVAGSGDCSGVGGLSRFFYWKYFA